MATPRVPQLTVDLVAALADVATRVPALLFEAGGPPRRAVGGLGPHRRRLGCERRFPSTARSREPCAPSTPWPGRRPPSCIPALVREVVAPFGADVDVDYQRGVPPAVNDPTATEAFRVAVADELGGIEETEQSMGAEDFAWLLAKVPGVLARLGVRRPGAVSVSDLHRGDFTVDEDAIATGIRALVAAALGAQTGAG